LSREDETVIFGWLQHYVGLDKREAEDFFDISENATEYVLKARRWLEIGTFNAMKRLIKDKAGSYTPPNNTDSAIFQIPKTKPSVTPDVVTMENQRINSQPEVGNAIPIEETYSLKKSSEKLGKLIPVLKDSKGNIIDGRHRKQVDPHWPSLTCHDIDSPIKLHLARLTANFCRRTVPREELEENIGFLIGAGLKPEKIAEETGISLRTVYNYMPQVLKDKVKVDAGRKGGEVAARLHQTVKTQDTPQTDVYAGKTECGICHQATPESEVKPFQDKKLCPSCFDRLPTAYKKVATIPKPENQVPKPKSIETWEHRKAQMHPPVSKFELKFDEESTKSGLPHGENNLPKWRCPVHRSIQLNNSWESSRNGERFPTEQMKCLEKRK